MAGVYRPRHPETKPEAERVGKYMLRPVLALERLTFLESEGKVGYRWGRDGVGQETMDYQEFISSVTSHILDKERGHGPLLQAVCRCSNSLII